MCDVNKVFRELAEWKLIEEQAKAEKEKREAIIKEYMQSIGQDTLIGDEHKATLKQEMQNRLDTKALKHDLPDIAEQYTKPSSRTVFRFS